MNGVDPVAVVAVVVTFLLLLLVWWLFYRPQPQQYQAPLAYGLDFSWSKPSPQAILAAGYTFVCRYHSWDTSGKNLTKAEADSYKDAGIAIVSNWEYYANAPAYGWDQGISDATEAKKQHAADGGGPEDPIYFSVDWDCQDWELPVVGDYFRAVISVIGLPRCGAYGGIKPIRYLFNCGLITYGWQTYAWSNGAWDTRAQLRQVQNGVTVGGATVDRNEAWAANYGAWGQSVPPAPEGDGAVLLNCPTDPKRLDLFYVGSNGNVWHRWYKGTMTEMWNGQATGVENLGGSVFPGTLTAAWTPDAKGINICALGGPDVDANPPPGCGQYWGSVIYTSGGKSGWGSLNNVYGQYPAGVLS